VLKDPGGELLDRLIGQSLGIETFIRLAVALASALARLHERSLIHKDIKPANILADCVTGRVWLTGFGIASRRTREQQSPDPPESIAGTLPFMAPEQTGRMNRSIDSRSDLYSLGVTLYQLFTGSLPFSAADPMEWVHCHIARKPVPPHERSEHIPPSVSAIVMKLLAKTAEDRYQTALGVESDLRRCLNGRHGVASKNSCLASPIRQTDCLFQKSCMGEHPKQKLCSRLSIAWSRTARPNWCLSLVILGSVSPQWSVNCIRHLFR
jgi:serine/threonine protein kinase